MVGYKTTSSRLANKLSPYASGSDGESEFNILNFHTQAENKSDVFNTTFKDILKKAPMSEELKQQATAILDSNPNRELSLHKNGETESHMGNFSTPWHTIITYKGNPNKQNTSTKSAEASPPKKTGSVHYSANENEAEL